MSFQYNSSVQEIEFVIDSTRDIVLYPHRVIQVWYSRIAEDTENKDSMQIVGYYCDHQPLITYEAPSYTFI